jgi:hypothetical protein
MDYHTLLVERLHIMLVAEEVHPMSQDQTPQMCRAVLAEAAMVVWQELVDF